MNQKIILIIIFSLASVVVPSTASTQQTLNLEKNDFVFYAGQQSFVTAILEKRLREAFKRIGGGFTLKFIYTVSSQRALIIANQEGDGSPERAKNIKQIAPEETTNLIQVPEPIYYRKLYVYTKRPFFSVNGYKSLDNLRNGFRNGIKILEKNMPGEKTMLPDLVRLFQMLDDGRLDTVTVLNDFIADQVIKENNFSGITRLQPPLIAMPTYTLIHKKHAPLVPEIARALKEMKADGTFEINSK